MKKNLLILSFTLFNLLSLSSCKQNNIIQSETYGKFYDVSELYNEYILSDEDILNISYYNNNLEVYNSSYKKLDKSEYSSLLIERKDLSKDIESKIIYDQYINLLNNDTYLNYKDYYKYPLSLEDITISTYCGYFNGYYFIKFNEFKIYDKKEDFLVIGQYSFLYENIDLSSKVVAWKSLI